MRKTTQTDFESDLDNVHVLQYVLTRRQKWLKTLYSVIQRLLLKQNWVNYQVINKSIVLISALQNSKLHSFLWCIGLHYLFNKYFYPQSQFLQLRSMNNGGKRTAKKLSSAADWRCKSPYRKTSPEWAYSIDFHESNNHLTATTAFVSAKNDVGIIHHSTLISF